MRIYTAGINNENLRAGHILSLIFSLKRPPLKRIKIF
nr:MAG TPA: hypothetical protein [Caudoviricetes sp.]